MENFIEVGLDLFSEELFDDFADLSAEALPSQLAPALSSASSFTSGSSFSCPGSTLGTLSTVGTWS